VDKGNRLTTAVAVVGTVLLGLLLLTTLVLSGTAPAGAGSLAYLAVAAIDLFPVALLGGCLLIWATLRARSHRRVVVLSLAMPAASIAVGMLWSPVVPTSGWSWVGVLVIVLWLGLMIATAAGVSLVRALVLKTRRPAPVATVRG